MEVSCKDVKWLKRLVILINGDHPIDARRAISDCLAFPAVQPSIFYRNLVFTRMSPLMFKQGNRKHKGHTFLRNHRLGSSKINTTGACPPHLKSIKKTHQNTTVNDSHSLPGHGSDRFAEHGGGDGRGDGNAKDSSAEGIARIVSRDNDRPSPSPSPFSSSSLAQPAAIAASENSLERPDLFLDVRLDDQNFHLPCEELVWEFGAKLHVKDTRAVGYVRG